MTAGGKASSIANKIKRTHKRKREEEFERMDSLPWSASLPIGEDDEGETFSTLFAGSGQLDGGFLSLEEIDEADYNLAIPTTDSERTEKGLNSKKQTGENNDGNNDSDNEIIEGEEEEEEKEVEDGEESKDEDNVESRKIKEKNLKKKKLKKKKKQKRIKEAELDQDSSAG